MSTGVVSHLRLRAPATRAATARMRVEDALRLAIPDDRLLVLRRLDLGRLPAQAPATAWQDRAAARVAAQRARAVHAATPGSASADAVWFQSFAEARRLLLLELAAGRRPVAWFWRLAVPGWDGADPRAWLPRLLATAPADPTVEPVLAGVVLAAAAAGRLAPLVAALAACPLPRPAALPDGAAPQPRRGAPVPAPATEHADRVRRSLARLDAATRAALLRVLTAGPPSSPGTVWLARLTLIAAEPGISAEPGVLASATAALLTHAGMPAPAADAPRRTEAAEPTGHENVPAQIGQPSPPAGFAPDHRPVPAPGVEPVSQPLPPPPTVPTEPGTRRVPEAAVTAPPGLEQPSAGAGVFLLLRPLVRMGFPDWLEARPGWAADGFGAALLRAIAVRLRIAADDPLFGLLPPHDTGVVPPLPPDPSRFPPLHTPPVIGGPRSLGSPRPPTTPRGATRADPEPWDAALTAWRIGLDRWLRRTAAIRLSEVVRRRGWLTASDAELTIRFRHDDADIRLRRKALDIDPGWVPWLGWVVRYAYRDEPAA